MSMTSRLNLRDMVFMQELGASLYILILLLGSSVGFVFSSNIYKLISMVLKSSTSWLYLIILVFIDFIYGMFNKKKDIQLEFFFYLYRITSCTMEISNKREIWSNSTLEHYNN